MQPNDPPLLVASTDQLGPMIEAEMAEYSDGAYAKHSDARYQLRQFARAVQAAERERWIAATDMAASALRELERYEYVSATVELRTAVATLRSLEA